MATTGDLREETARARELRKFTMLAQEIPDSLPREISPNHGHFHENSRGTRCNHEKSRGCKKFVVSKKHIKNPMIVAHYFHENSRGTKRAPRTFSWNQTGTTRILVVSSRRTRTKWRQRQRGGHRVGNAHRLVWVWRNTE